MACIEKCADRTGKRRYRVKMRLKGGRAESATFDRLTDAKRWAKQIESAILEGHYFGTSECKRHTLRETLRALRA